MEKKNHFNQGRMNKIPFWSVCLLSALILSCSSGGGGGESPSDTAAPQDEAGNDTNPSDDISDHPISFTLDQGYRINFASNPRILSYEKGQLKLGYEYQARELTANPSDKGYVAFSTDGLTFSGNRRFQQGENKERGVLIDNEIWRRYAEDEGSGKVMSESSTDGVNYSPDDGYRYDLNTNDSGKMGVRTFFVDQYGGVVMLYNSDISVNGKEVIFVRRAYSKPGDKGLHFELTDDDVMGMTYDDGVNQSFADPNAIVLPDGRVRLIVMQQDRGQPLPPLGRTGTIYSFISDDGSTFQMEARLFSWENFSEFEVRSLNDPKIIRFDDGSYHIYVAAMIPTESGEEDQGEYKWVIVSAACKE